ncbi:MAG TPA: transglutaminase-like domain-containing protein [Pirellulales bacterium]
MISRRAALRALVGSLAVGTSARFAWAEDSPVSSESDRLVRYTDDASFHIEMRAEITLGEFALSELEVWLPVPQNDREQTIRNLKLPESHVALVTTANGTAQVARLLQKKNLPGPGQKTSFAIEYDLVSRKGRVDAKRLAALPYAPYPAALKAETWLAPEEKVQAKSAKIAEIAATLAGERRPAQQIARAAYEWVLERTTYQLIDGFGGATYCLEKQHGECGDYSALFVALCRAAGVPARIVAGAWADQTDGWHVWAEFLLPTGEWSPVDGSLGDGNPRARVFYFGNRESNRVGLTKAADVTLLEGSREPRSISFLQTGAWWWWTKQTYKGKTGPNVEFRLTGAKTKS